MDLQQFFPTNTSDNACLKCNTEEEEKKGRLDTKEWKVKQV